MNHRPIRILAACAVLTAPVLLGACGDSDPKPAKSDPVTTTTEAMTESSTDGSMTDDTEMDDGKTTTTEAMSDGTSMDDGKSTSGSMTDDTKMDDGTTTTTEAMSGDSMSEG